MVSNWEREIDVQSEMAMANALYDIAYHDSTEQYDFVHVIPSDIVKVIETYYYDDEEWIWAAVREGDWDCTIHITGHNGIKILAYCDMWKGLITIVKDDG